MSKPPNKLESLIAEKVETEKALQEAREDNNHTNECYQIARLARIRGDIETEQGQIELL